MFEWCSISVISTSSPGPTLLRPQAYATRLIASVTFFVKIVVPASQPQNLATRSRAPSYRSVASSASR